MTTKKRIGALDFINHEASSGVFLMFAALLALVFANTGVHPLYDAFLDTPVSVRVGALEIDKPLLLWINDGLMAIFFFIVGLEIKREIVTGELSSPSRAALPAFAAFGGMAVPALIYWLANFDDPVALQGWAIPCATDIAFAVGVLALLGSRVPVALKIFLLALAIIDDLGAIVIIALFYTTDLSPIALALAGVGVAVLIVMNLAGVTRVAAYVLAGVFIWVCVLKSGVHATLAAVVTALAVPLTKGQGDEMSPLEQLEENLHPWVTFAVLPLFAFANAGVSLEGVTLWKLTESVPFGIAAGLVLGKPIGIIAFTALAVAAGIGARPGGASWLQLLGVGALAGIGFTMSLFIGTLAFSGMQVDIRIGVLAGSVISALVGFILLRSGASHSMSDVTKPT